MGALIHVPKWNGSTGEGWSSGMEVSSGVSVVREGEGKGRGGSGHPESDGGGPSRKAVVIVGTTVGGGAGGGGACVKGFRTPRP